MARRRSLKVPDEFDDALERFQGMLRKGAGVEVSKTSIMRGMAPRIEEIMVGDMMSEPEMPRGKKKKPAGWRFTFLE